MTETTPQNVSDHAQDTGLTQKDFHLTDKTLHEMNAAIQNTVIEHFRNHPDEDPLDSLSVTFTFVFGMGSQIMMNVAGENLSFEAD